MANTEQRLDIIETKVDGILERNILAFERLNETMESIKIAMIELANSVRENRKETNELFIAINEPNQNVNILEQKIS